MRNLKNKSEKRRFKKTSSSFDELKRLKKELRESEDRFRMLVEQSPENIVTHDLEGKILFISASGVEMIGAKTSEEVIGRNAMEFVHPDDHEKVKNITMEAIKEFENGVDCKKVIEHRFIRLDGTEFYGEATGIPFLYKGEPAIQVITRDITKRKEAEDALNRVNDKLENMVNERTEKLSKAIELLKKEISERKHAEKEKERIQTQLLQAQKMEIIGRFASGIAHDFNNITTIIKSFSALALAETSKGRSFDLIKEYLGYINATAERSANLTRQLLISAQKQPTNFRNLKLNNIVDDMTKTLRHVLAENITVRTVLEPGLWDIFADKGNIEQILMNLVINASDAMEQGGGMIYIKTKNMVVDEDCTDIPGVKSGKFVCLTFEDSGAGMEAEVVERLFEPFFSTKDSGKGIGLGLAVVNNIVKEHKGAITVSSEPERGSIFKVYLPATTETALFENIDDLAGEPSGRGERILLVEDEKFLRKSLTLMLSKNNYTVFDAENATEAVETFEKHGGEFDLLFTDVVLPDISGIHLTRKLLARNPDLKVVFTSGYLNIESQWSFIKDGGYAFLQKPYDPLDLLTAINETLLK